MVCQVLAQQYRYMLNGEAVEWDTLIKEGWFDDYDFQRWIEFAEWEIEMGEINEPFYDFNLQEFVLWCKSMSQSPEVRCPVRITGSGHNDTRQMR